jgi:hypothetical protein
MNACVATKDKLLQRLNDAVTLEQRIEVTNEVLIALELTSGLWVDLKYAYKAKEIAERCRSVLEKASEMCGHPTKHKRVNELRAKAITVAQAFHVLQQQSMEM